MVIEFRHLELQTNILNWIELKSTHVYYNPLYTHEKRSKIKERKIKKK